MEYEEYINLEVECSCMEKYINTKIPYDDCRGLIWIECQSCGEDIILKDGE